MRPATNTTLQGVPKEATFEQFDAQAQGEMELVRGESLARKSDVQLRVVMVFQAPGRPMQRSAAADPGQPPAARCSPRQMQSQATFVRGDDLRAAMHSPEQPPASAATPSARTGRRRLPETRREETVSRYTGAQR